MIFKTYLISFLDIFVEIVYWHVFIPTLKNLNDCILYVLFCSEPSFPLPPL